MARGAKADLPFFPLLLNLRGRKCLVVGAGTVAAGKIDGLLSYGAKIVVVSPVATAGIERQARTGALKLIQREFSPKDIKGAFLVIAATNSSAVNGSVFRACRAQRILCNSVDDPEHCDFFYPAVVRRGPLQIAISTNGNLPALASRLRKELEQQFGSEWATWTEQLGKRRRQLLARNIPSEKRRELLLQLASAESFEAYSRKRAKTKAAKPNSAKPGR